MKHIMCVIAVLATASACGSTQQSLPLETVSPTTHTTSGVDDVAPNATRGTQLQSFVKTLRAKLGDDFVGTEGATDGKGIVTAIDVILLDSESARNRVPEVRELFVATVPTIAPRALRFVFAPISEKALLAAYEAFGQWLAAGAALAGFSSATVDRASGSLVVVLDGSKP